MLDIDNIIEKLNDKITSYGDDVLAKAKYSIDIEINYHKFFIVNSLKEILKNLKFEKITEIDKKDYLEKLEKINNILNVR